MFAIAILASAFVVITASNPVTAVLSLILTFFYTGGLFVLLEAEFIAFSLIIVYVGAVAVLFLFVVMLINIKKESFSLLFSKYKTPVIFVGIFILIEMCTLLLLQKHHVIADDLSIFSMRCVKTGSNIHAIGELLYTHYFLAFQLSGLILLIAMISAIVLVHEKRTDRRRQNVKQQLMRSKHNSLEVISVSPVIKEDI